jgi:hypothetical protein
MNVDMKLFKDLYNDDIIYHYTAASIAIDFILFKTQLKFSESRKSNDPIESSIARRGIVYFDADVGKPKEKEKVLASDKLLANASSQEEKFCQICFCKNHMGEEFASKNYIGDIRGREEIFGFTKLRMWDQYADKFKGVCIAFSKEKILSANKEKLNIIDGDVEYLTFEKLWSRKQGDIHGNPSNREEYEKKVEEKIKQSFFYKHLDYKGENEYRIGTFYKGELVLDKTIMLDISGCIEAIIMSSYTNEKQKSDLLEYANKLNIPLIEMNWKHDSFEAIDYKEEMKYLEEEAKRLFNLED